MQYAVINISDTKNIPLKGFVTIGIAGDSSPLHRVSLEIATCRNRLDTFISTHAHLSFFFWPGHLAIVIVCVFTTLL
jgi:hypothetical protein